MKKMLGCFILMLFTTPLFAAVSENDCPEFPFFYPKTGPLAHINCDFHHAYEKRVEQIIATFGAVNGRPIIINLGGTLILKAHGETKTININPDQYHQIKAYAHITFTLYLILSQQTPGYLQPETKAALLQLMKDSADAYAQLLALKLGNEANEVIAKLAMLNNQLLKEVILTGTWQQSDLDRYYQNATPLALRAVNLVAAIELTTLDQAVTSWLQQLTNEEKQKLGIVIATSHQARAEEISWQYFAKKFAKHDGVGAINEDGLVVLEGKFDEASALSLLARHYLDREASAIIFHDEMRLQRDLLSDGAKLVLGK